MSDESETTLQTSTVVALRCPAVVACPSLASLHLPRWWADEGEGANGPQGNEAAVSAFKAGPGYQWNVDQALEQIMRKQNALGGLQGGNTLAGLTDRASNLANQEYGGWLDRLAGFVNPELTATGGAASGTSGAYQGLGTSIVRTP